MLPMNLTAQLLRVADVYGELTNRSRARVSTMVLNQGRRLDRYAEGSLSPSVKVLERAMAWFSANWPEGAVWPEGVERPRPAVASAALPSNEAVEASA